MIEPPLLGVAASAEAAGVREVMATTNAAVIMAMTRCVDPRQTLDRPPELGSVR